MSMSMLTATPFPAEPPPGSTDASSGAQPSRATRLRQGAAALAVAGAALGAGLVVSTGQIEDDAVERVQVPAAKVTPGPSRLFSIQDSAQDGRQVKPEAHAANPPGPDINARRKP